MVIIVLRKSEPVRSANFPPALTQANERAKTELKALVPEDAKEAIGHGVRARRSKSGAISFDLQEVGGGHAAVE